MRQISIHALREEGDQELLVHTAVVFNFYPRPPRGGRRLPWSRAILASIFLSTPSARRATCVLHNSDSQEMDFYPRPPRGGRRADHRRGGPSERFLSTPSARRATSDRLKPNVLPAFLSTPSARRATAYRFSNSSCWHFYPRPPRGGRLDVPCDALHFPGISIHALREEGDSGQPARSSSLFLFLSTPSARRATRNLVGLIRFLDISIHALREEGDKPVPFAKFIF